MSVDTQAAVITGSPEKISDLLIKAAIASFARIGYSGTSVRTIAQGAGVTVAAVYNHYVSKQEILYRIMNNGINAAKAAIDAAWEPSATPPEQLRALVEALVQFNIEHTQIAFIGGSEIRSLEEPGRSDVVAVRDAIEARFREVVDAGMERGDFAKTDPRLVTRAILAIATSVAAWYRPDGRVRPEDLMADYGQIALRTAGYHGKA